MKRVVTQLKKRIDCVDFRKIYNGFIKCNFLLRYDNVLYGINKEYILEPKEKGQFMIIRDNIKYAVIDYPIGNLDYDQLVIELIVVMFKVFNSNNCKKGLVELELKYLTTYKNQTYYENKYQQNLLIAKILSGNTRYLKLCNKYYESRLRNNPIAEIEKRLEELNGLELYIKLQTTKIVKPALYESMLNPIISSLEDPSKLFDYLSYTSTYGAALLLIKNVKVKLEYNYINNVSDKLIINFASLYRDYSARMKKIMMYKMVHAKKMKIIGKLSNAYCQKILVSDNLYYLPDYIEYVDGNAIKFKKGNFIVKMNEELEISEFYECMSLEKIK